MFRDEEGYLSEWIAYYQMHGFDHIHLFDDESIDHSLAEVQPWIDEGYVSISSNWTLESLNISYSHRKNQFKSKMAVKAVLESGCKALALKWNYDFFVSLDLDEYMIPLNPGATILDELDRVYSQSGRIAQCIEKLNFQSTPHILEPVNLLTIEAYQTRMPISGKMNYYMTVANKCAYALNGEDFTNNTAIFLEKCCSFHGCNGHDFVQGEVICKHNYRNEAAKIMGKDKKWMNGFVINHYSRSLEKYALKQRTWKTATGEQKQDQTSEQAANGYDIPKFLARNVGWHTDDTALRYSCQLRELIKNITKKDQYFRPGTTWYRNPEFGLHISDPDKRGRYGRTNPIGFKYEAAKNPYHYDGTKQKGNSKKHFNN
jgi:hypothetical protein